MDSIKEPIMEQFKKDFRTVVICLLYNVCVAIVESLDVVEWIFGLRRNNFAQIAPEW